MKQLIFLLVLAVLSDQNSFGQLLEKYTASPIRSEINWTGSAAFSSYQLTGTIPLKTGEIILKDGWVQSCYLEFNLQEIQHDEDKLVKHLKSDDFFDVKVFPTALFTLTEPCEIIDNEVLAIGKLTIKDVTQAEQFDVALQLKGEQVVCTFSSAVNRVDYGVNHNSPSLFENLKDDAIADEFTLEGKLFFQLQE